MKSIAKVYDSDGSVLVKCDGSTPEEARQKCLVEIAKYIRLETDIGGGIELSSHDYERMPKILPQGYGLLIMESCSHQDGCPGIAAFIAVKHGKHVIDYVEFEIGETPVKHTFIEGNPDLVILLPQGSMTYRNGVTPRWFPCDMYIEGYRHEKLPNRDDFISQFDPHYWDKPTEDEKPKNVGDGKTSPRSRW